MSTKGTFVSAGLILLLVSGAVALAEQSSPDSAPTERPSVVPLIVSEPPTIDGEVLGDEAYAGAVPATDFWQTQPRAGEPSSERTEVYIVSTANTLYFGVVCYDREPEKII